MSRNYFTSKCVGATWHGECCTFSGVRDQSDACTLRQPGSPHVTIPVNQLTHKTGVRLEPVEVVDLTCSGSSPRVYVLACVRECRWDSSTVALVTGSNKGIGFSIAQLLAEQGVSVVIAARNPDLGNAAVAELKKAVPEATATFCQLDITDAVSVTSCAAHIDKEFGKLDILVNNAGIAYKGNTFGPEEAATTMACNVKGTRAVSEAMLPLLNASGGGRIVNLCSR